MLGPKQVLLFFVTFAGVASAASAAECPFDVEQVTRITNSPGVSQTARGNGRCVAVDAGGTAHLVWEDARDGNFEIYYASYAAGARSPEVRITRTSEDSNFPCVACDGDRVHILYQEKVNKTWQVFYVCRSGGKEILRRQLTDAPTGAECPATAVGPDGTLHAAWHEGVGAATTIHYARIVDGALEARAPVCAQHLSALRPDVACDQSGRVLVAWYEGSDVKSRLWDGTAWQDEQLVAHNTRQSWRLSATSLGDGRWALAWFDQASKSTDVWAAIFDGRAWSGQTRINAGQTGFYPAIASYGPGRALVVWEDQDKPRQEYLLMMRCLDGSAWGEPAEIARGRAMSRYASLAPAGRFIHALWFAGPSGDSDIYHCLLRRR